MKALLMHRDRDFALGAEVPPNERDLTQDLELDTLLDVMAGGDGFVRTVAREALLVGCGGDVDAVLYRQRILRDCLDNPDVARELYGIAIEGVNAKKGRYYFSSLTHSPSVVLYDSTEVMQALTGTLRKLRAVGEAHVGRFRSEGLLTFFAMVRAELDEAYLAGIDEDLRRLKFRSGVLTSARLGAANQSAGYVLRKPTASEETWLDRLLHRGPPRYTYHLAERDEAGARILSDMHGHAINLVANALAQSADHVLGFFEMLRTELAFYVGCLNLRDRLAAAGAPIAFPRPEVPGSRRYSAEGLYDPCLALRMRQRIVGNRLNGDGKGLVLITGANQGGKSSFLRALGVAQLMIQAGLFVAAESFAAELVAGIHTHYKREEDATMESGKLDEELRRMSAIADVVGPRALVLFNESFASTNEREGSEIARQVVHALLETGIKVLFVTHQFDFARGVLDEGRDDVLFLRAERRPDGSRTFTLVEGEPFQTSYGEDLYREVFRGTGDEGEAPWTTTHGIEDARGPNTNAVTSRDPHTHDWRRAGPT
jgi:hypothetical protein